MKSTIAVFASLALALFVAGQSPASAGQATGQGVRTAQGSMARIATFIPAPPYSKPRTAPVLVACKGKYVRCEDSSECCTGMTCTPPDPRRGGKGGSVCVGKCEGESESCLSTCFLGQDGHDEHSVEGQACKAECLRAKNRCVRREQGHIYD